MIYRMYCRYRAKFHLTFRSSIQEFQCSQWGGRIANEGQYLALSCIVTILQMHLYQEA